ncbi:hypothetical protein [Microbacterium sp. F2]|uniref:hypothetical protein n=1 Tax=Microbacterium sp. F2 TaxID=3422228 RepID=UPI003FCFA112
MPFDQFLTASAKLQLTTATQYIVNIDHAVTKSALGWIMALDDAPRISRAENNTASEVAVMGDMFAHLPSSVLELLVRIVSARMGYSLVINAATSSE